MMRNVKQPELDINTRLNQALFCYHDTKERLWSDGEQRGRRIDRDFGYAFRLNCDFSSSLTLGPYDSLCCSCKTPNTDSCVFAWVSVYKLYIAWIKMFKKACTYALDPCAIKCTTKMLWYHIYKKEKPSECTDTGTSLQWQREEVLVKSNVCPPLAMPARLNYSLPHSRLSPDYCNSEELLMCHFVGCVRAFITSLS